jgi:hypothetical protein
MWNDNLIFRIPIYLWRSASNVQVVLLSFFPFKSVDLGYMHILGKFTIFISHKTRIKIVFSGLKSRYVCPSWHFRQHNCQVTSYNSSQCGYFRCFECMEIAMRIRTFSRRQIITCTLMKYNYIFIISQYNNYDATVDLNRILIGILNIKLSFHIETNI